MKDIPRHKEMTQSETLAFSRAVCAIPLIVVLHTSTLKWFAQRYNIVSGYLSLTKLCTTVL